MNKSNMNKKNRQQQKQKNHQPSLKTEKRAKTEKPLKKAKNTNQKRLENKNKAEKEQTSLSLHPYLKALKSPEAGLEMLYGYHAVKAALQNPARQIEALVINPKAQGKVKELYQKLNDSAPHEFDLIEMERQYFELLIEDDVVHQSIVLFCHPQEEWDISDLFEKEQALLIVLDQATDIGNIGAVLRSCAAFGADALIVPERHSPHVTAHLAKAAVGAFEHVPLIRVNNLKAALDKLKENGFWVIGMDGHTDDEIDDVQLAEKTALIIGSEGEGMRRLTKENCDFLVKIPMNKKMESLNMSVAAAIGLYALSKKMKKI